MAIEDLVSNPICTWLKLFIRMPVEEIRKKFFGVLYNFRVGLLFRVLVRLGGSGFFWGGP